MKKDFIKQRNKIQSFLAKIVVPCFRKSPMLLYVVPARQFIFNIYIVSIIMGWKLGIFRMLNRIKIKVDKSVQMNLMVQN